MAISESIDIENQDDNGLSSLVKVFNQEIESVSLPENDEICESPRKILFDLFAL